MSDKQGDIFSALPFDPRSRITFWHSDNGAPLVKGKLDPHIRILKSHQETIDGETVTVIDSFEVMEVSIVP